MTEGQIEEQKDQIVEYACLLNTTINATSSSELVEYVVNEVYDRAKLYLNRDSVPEDCNRVLARVVVGVFSQTYNNQSSTSTELVATSLSDNGQSIGYSNEVKKYLVGTDDDELFRGFSKLLAPYRRPNVVS